MAKNNNITIIDQDNCVGMLKAAYNLTKDLLIVKSQEKINRSTIVDIEYYNPDTKYKLDKGKCEEGTVSLNIPFTMNAVEKQRYNMMRQAGIDILNPDDPAFTTTCFTFVDPETDYDTTLNLRLDKYYSNNTPCAVNGCLYKKFNDDGYIQCECSPSGEYFNSLSFINSRLACTSEVKVNIF
jgi:hypothetical protein